MTKDKDEDDGYVSPDEVYGKDKQKLSFKIIVLMQLKRITELQSVEWIGGYWTNKIKMLGNGISTTERIYKQDTREEFNNSINCLYDLIHPYFDKEMLDFSKTWRGDLTKLEKKKVTEQFFIDKVNLHRKIYRALGSFLKRKQYFKGQLLVD